MTSPDDHSSAATPISARLWLRVAIGLVVAFLLLFAFVLWMLTHLEHPWVKKRVEAILSDVVGTDVSYDRLSISPFSGLEAEGLSLRRLKRSVRTPRRCFGWIVSRFRSSFGLCSPGVS